jgi:hypothetical protein
MHILRGAARAAVSSAVKSTLATSPACREKQVLRGALLHGVVFTAAWLPALVTAMPT